MLGQNPSAAKRRGILGMANVLSAPGITEHHPLVKNLQDLPLESFTALAITPVALKKWDVGLLTEGQTSTALTR